VTVGHRDNLGNYFIFGELVQDLYSYGTQNLRDGQKEELISDETDIGGEYRGYYLLYL
jgi:hypothetical protein